MSKGKITEFELHPSLLNKIKNSAGKVKLIRGTTQISAATNSVEVNIVGFNKTMDSILVFKNSTFLDESEYTIDDDSTHILKKEGQWNELNEQMTFTFLIFKYVPGLEPGESIAGLQEADVKRLIREYISGNPQELLLLLKDTKIEVTDKNNYFEGATLDAVLDELYNKAGTGGGGPVSIDAASVSYDDSVTQLGVSTLQDAINTLFTQIRTLKTDLNGAEPLLAKANSDMEGIISGTTSASTLSEESTTISETSNKEVNIPTKVKALNDVKAGEPIRAADVTFDDSIAGVGAQDAQKAIELLHKELKALQTDFTNAESTLHQTNTELEAIIGTPR